MQSQGSINIESENRWAPLPSLFNLSTLFTAEVRGILGLDFKPDVCEVRQLLEVEIFLEPIEKFIHGSIRNEGLYNIAGFLLFSSIPVLRYLLTI